MDDVMKMDKNHVWSTIAPTLLSYCSAIKNTAYRRIKEFYKYCLVGEEGATSIRVKKVLTVSARFPEWKLKLSWKLELSWKLKLS